MAWYNNIGDLLGDVKQIATGHNPANNPPPSPIPLGPTSSGPTIPQPIPTGQTGFSSTQPVYPGASGIPGMPDTSGDSGGSGGIDWGSLVSKIPGWVMDGLKVGLPAAVEWMKNNGSTLLQGAGIADAAYREMQADKYATQAFKMAQDAYNAKAPLRSAGIAGMLAPTGNPFSQNQHTSAYQTAPAQTSGVPGAPAGAPLGTPTSFGRLTPLVPKQFGRLTPMAPPFPQGQ